MLIAGCAAPEKEAAPTLTAFPTTSTLAPTIVQQPSETPLPPPPQPTTAPVEGISSTQLNVRAEPSTAANILGVIPGNTRLEIVGKDPGGNWWQILYPDGPEGRGWVNAQYATVSNAESVPVIGGETADPNDGNVAIVQQQINVRSGPGTGFNSLGTLNAQDVVSLTGKDANGAWLQISFTPGPDGKGWVNAAFVQARGVDNLPIITEAGQVVGTGTPTGIPPTRTPTVIPAWEDGDSPENPAASVTFEAAGTNRLIYSGDLSAPDGDTEDWVTFKPYTQTVFLSLSCTGSGSLQAEILENGTPMNIQLVCGAEMRQVSVNPGSTHSVHFSVSQSSNSLEYVGYTINIQSMP